MLDEKSLDQFVEELKSEIGLHSLRLYITRNNDIKLGMIAVPKEFRMEGRGSRAMEALCAMADRENMRIVLTVGQRDDKWGTTSASRLYDFYKRFGFVKNSGRNKDFTIMESMYRNPKSQLKLRENMKKLSFKKYLIEMPLPADWDKDKMGTRNSFASKIRYAKERAQQIGTGSSRVAFVIPYKGRNTVLKVAKNSKGLHQNEYEADKLGDWYLKDLGITIPMIDYDEEDDQPSWIHTEFAFKAKPSDFMKAFGMSVEKLIIAAELMAGKRQPSSNEREWMNNTLNDMMEDNELFSGFVNLIGNYDIPIMDFSRLANWGIYNGYPVIIDLGLSNDIWANLYQKKAQPSQWR